jgi:RNA recognition motif-containing protein
LAAFSVFGPLKGIKRVINSKNGKLRPYCFVEFEQEKDLEGCHVISFVLIV